VIICIALLVCVVATAALWIWAAWEHQQVEGLERIAEHQEAMRALNPRTFA